MKPYCRQCQDITDEHMELPEKVKAVVATLHDDLTCHQVCAEIVKVVPGLIHKRGHFFIYGVQHSWLEVKMQAPGDIVIIDAYPIAVASGPILVTTHGILNPWRFFYRTEDNA